MPSGNHFFGYHAALTCARPAFGCRSLRHAPCNPRAFAHLTPQSLHRRRRRMFVPLSIGQHSPAHAPRGSLRSAASTSCIDPTHKQQPRRRSSDRPRTHGGHSCRRSPRPWGGRRIARTGLPLSFLRCQAFCAPQSRGEMQHSATNERSALMQSPVLRSTKYICLLNAQSEPTAQA